MAGIQQRQSPTEDRRHSTSDLHQEAIWETAQKPGVPVNAATHRPQLVSTYAKSFRFRDDDRCVCGAQEIVTYVLEDCPNLRDIRRGLRREVGDAFGSVSSLLGGSTEGETGKPDTVSRAKTVKAVLDFAEASHRFWSRAPRGQPNNGNGS